jgi:uncharacterized protein (TIGR02996 family)
VPKELFSADELHILGAIHDDPRNDRPRLAYADWLETQGLPGFAEFIRIQCREPYFILEMGADPRVDIETYWIKHDDPARANRAIELLRPLYNSDRFPKTYLFAQIRGLPRGRRPPPKGGNLGAALPVRLQHAYNAIEA